MKESRPKNATKRRARMETLTTPRPDYEQEREEIAKIATMLTDGGDVYFLLGVAQGLIELEAKKNPHVT